MRNYGLTELRSVDAYVHVYEAEFCLSVCVASVALTLTQSSSVVPHPLSLTLHLQHLQLRRTALLLV